MNSSSTSSKRQHIPGVEAVVAALVSVLGSMVAIVISSVDAAAKQVQVRLQCAGYFCLLAAGSTIASLHGRCAWRLLLLALLLPGGV